MCADARGSLHGLPHAAAVPVRTRSEAAELTTEAVDAELQRH